MSNIKLDVGWTLSRKEDHTLPLVLSEEKDMSIG